MNDIIELEKRINEKIKNINLNISEIRAQRLNGTVETHVKSLQDQVDKLVSNGARMLSMIQVAINDPKVFKEIDDNNLTKLFIESGVHLKELADKFTVSIGMANKYAKGEIQDKKIRHDLATFFQLRIIDNRNKKIN